MLPLYLLSDDPGATWQRQGSLNLAGFVNRIHDPDGRKWHLLSPTFRCVYVKSLQLYLISGPHGR